MKILIYGVNGFIGKYLEKYLLEHDNIEIVKSLYSRIFKKEQVLNDINNTNPDCIVSCIGFVKTEKCKSTSFLEDDFYLFDNLQNNLYIHNVIMSSCNEKNIHFTYIGTGCIYNANNNKIFNEYDEPNFFNSKYSLVKGFTDKLIKLNDKALLIRIRQCLSNCNNQQNFLNKFLQFKNISDIQNSYTVIPSIFPIISKLIIQKKRGIFNCVNKGSISVKEINEIFNKKNKNIIDKKIAYKKYSNIILSTKKLEKLFEVEHIKDAILLLKDSYIF